MIVIEQRICRDVFLLNKPNLYISDFFVKTPLAFEGSTTDLASARSVPPFSLAKSGDSLHVHVEDLTSAP